MHVFSELRSRHGQKITVGFDFSNDFSDLALQGHVDAFIVSTEDGFSSLGKARSFFSSDLGIPEATIRRWANWNRFDNPRVTLTSFASRKKNSRLRGLILAPAETSECYKQYATPFYGKPYRDFYYNVTYEAISHATHRLGARKLAISHLSGSGNFHQDIATCKAEALAHFCDEDSSHLIDSFCFVGCCIDPEHLSAIQRLNKESSTGCHRPITTEIESREDCELIHLSWTLGL